MTYQPVVPGGGNIGWSFLQRTREAQQEAFDQSAQIVRDTDYFREKIGEVTSAADLVADRRLRSVTLAAFGLSDDIDNIFYVQKVLEDGTLARDAFANRLSDKRYFAMAEAFSFDLSPPNTVKSDFADDIIARYKEREFEVAVGNADPDLRLALGLERELDVLAERDLPVDAQWFTIMGTPPLRRVFETAFALPPEFGAVDIDRQLEVFKEKAQRVFGTDAPAEFAAPERQEELIRNFLFRSQLNAASATTTQASVALSLLASSQSASLF